AVLVATKLKKRDQTQPSFPGFVASLHGESATEFNLSTMSGKAAGEMIVEIGCALVGITIDDRVGRADQRDRTIQRHRGTEEIMRCPVTRHQRRRLTPGAA